MTLSFLGYNISFYPKVNAPSFPLTGTLWPLRFLFLHKHIDGAFDVEIPGRMFGLRARAAEKVKAVALDGAAHILGQGQAVKGLVMLP